MGLSEVVAAPAALTPDAPPRRNYQAARLCPALLLSALLAACGSTPRTTPPEAGTTASVDTTRDGPPASPPPDLIDRPDPEPRVEAIRTKLAGACWKVAAAPLGIEHTALSQWYRINRAAVDSALAQRRAA